MQPSWDQKQDKRNKSRNSSISPSSTVNVICCVNTLFILSIRHCSDLCDKDFRQLAWPWLGWVVYQLGIGQGSRQSLLQFSFSPETQSIQKMTGSCSSSSACQWWRGSTSPCTSSPVPTPQLWVSSKTRFSSQFGAAPRKTRTATLTGISFCQSEGSQDTCRVAMWPAHT